MKNVKLILASFCLVLVGCSDDEDSVTGSSVAFTEGTYLVSSVMEYDGDCGVGTAVTEICMSDESITDADSCEGMCIDLYSYEMIDAADNATCTTAGGFWFGWISLTEMYADFTVTFGADGVFTNTLDGTGTYTVDGSELTITESYCEDSYGDEIEAADETACSESGGSWITEVQVATFDATGITTNLTEDGYCGDEDDFFEYGDYTTQEDCEANGSSEAAGDGVWYGPTCQSVLWIPEG